MLSCDSAPFPARKTLRKLQLHAVQFLGGRALPRSKHMRKSRFTEAQIIGMIKEQEVGMPTSEVCRRHGPVQPCQP
ncbi:transposase [Sulfitobacter dubius]|uniref:transposase n=1 Tax=Sulfitobacter dubius TaxID=218673 RepID=UPI00374C99FD